VKGYFLAAGERGERQAPGLSRKKGECPSPFFKRKFRSPMVGFDPGRNVAEGGGEEDCRMQMPCMRMAQLGQLVISALAGEKQESSRERGRKKRDILHADLGRGVLSAVCGKIIGAEKKAGFGKKGRRAFIGMMSSSTRGVAVAKGD